jgi:hypothetical protein
MMLKQALSLLNQFVPVGIAMKGLQKVNPKLKRFLGTSAALGYGANEIIEFLREKAQSVGERQFRSSLQERVSNGMARPDEGANLERLNQSALPGNLLQGAAASGIGALGGLGAAGMINKGAKSTITPLIEQTTPQASGEEKPGIENLFKQYPQLGKAINAEMSKGSPIEIAAREVKKKKLLKPIISKIENQVGQPFEDVVSQLFYGFGERQQPSASSSGAGQQRLDAVLSRIFAARGK